MNHQLTVGNLIQLLKDYDSDVIVDVEGCDCSAPAVGVQGWDENYVKRQPPSDATIVEIQRERK